MILTHIVETHRLGYVLSPVNLGTDRLIAVVPHQMSKLDPMKTDIITITSYLVFIEADS